MDPAWLQSVVLLVGGPSYCAGVFVAPDVVATAYHCVASVRRPSVRRRDGTEEIGTTFAQDREHDLALLRTVGVGPARPVRAEPPAPGDRLWLVGHPFAQAAGGKLTDLLRWSVSEGVVSATGPWFIQTDAAMNPGNSGGPALDGEGRVVGVVSRRMNADGLGFLATGAALRELVAAPEPGSWLGGHFGAGVGMVAQAEAAVGGELWLAARDRVVARAFAGLGATGATAMMGTLGVRQRLGRGAVSVALEALGGGVAMGDEVGPLVGGRLGVGGAAVSAWWPVGTRRVGIGVTLEWPGPIGVF